MKDRLITLLGGLLALYAVIILLAPKTEPDYISRPLTTDEQRHGLSALMQWLEHENVETLSLRQRYDELINSPELAESGNLLVIHLPLLLPAQSDETTRLRSWLSAGNSLLILSAYNDFPEWTGSTRPGASADDYSLLYDLGFFIAHNTAFDDAQDGDNTGKLDLGGAENLVDYLRIRKRNLVPSATHPLHYRVNKLQLETRFLNKRQLELGSREKFRSVLPIIEDQDSGTQAIWELRLGNGKSIVSSYAGLFSNNVIAREDNAQFFMNIVSLNLASEGVVIFDDMHQGLTDIYDPQAFYGDPRLHNTLWFLFGFWLIYLVGRSNRIAPPLLTPPEVHAVDFVRAVGGLFARRLSRQDSVRGLFKHFFNDIRDQYGKPLNGEPVWDILEHSPRIARQDVDRLRNYYTATGRHTAKLVPLHNLLLTIRKKLS
jgi:hypothetical protein